MKKLLHLGLALCLLSALVCSALADDLAIDEEESMPVELEGFGVSTIQETTPVDTQATQALPAGFRNSGWQRHTNGRCSQNGFRARKCPRAMTPPRGCNTQDPTCCVTTTTCNAVLGGFSSSDNAPDALVMATLVGDLSALIDTDGTQPGLAANLCRIKQKWADLGADMASIQINQFEGSEADSYTYGGIFTAGETTFVVKSWFIGGGQDPSTNSAVPFKGNEGRQVWTPAYRYYEYIDSTNFYRDAKALGKKRYVFAGLSAGAMTSQFAVLDFKPAQVRGVYLFGIEKVGNTNFQVHYNFVVGDVTRVWWNRYDAWIEVPAADSTIADALPAGLPAFVNPLFQRLTNRRWWRIDPRVATGSATACQRMTADPALAAPCPGTPTASPACAQALNVDDHEPGAYIANIRACARASTADVCVANLAAITL